MTKGMSGTIEEGRRQTLRKGTNEDRTGIRHEGKQCRRHDRAGCAEGQTPPGSALLERFPQRQREESQGCCRDTIDETDEIFSEADLK